MKRVYLIIFIFVFLCNFTQISCQTLPDKGDLTDNTQPTSKKGTPSQDEIQKFIANGWVRYSDFGAKGDGKADDMAAIVATHVFANQHNLTVKADDKATYYIGAKKLTADVRTNTDFGTAAFLIDDTQVEDRNAHVFKVGCFTARLLHGDCN